MRYRLVNDFLLKKTQQCVEELYHKDAALLIDSLDDNAVLIGAAKNQILNGKGAIESLLSCIAEKMISCMIISAQFSIVNEIANSCIISGNYVVMSTDPNFALPEEQRATFVWIKSDDDWKICHVHISNCADSELTEAALDSSTDYEYKNDHTQSLFSFKNPNSVDSIGSKIKMILLFNAATDNAKIIKCCDDYSRCGDSYKRIVEAVYSKYSDLVNEEWQEILLDMDNMRAFMKDCPIAYMPVVRLGDNNWVQLSISRAADYSEENPQLVLVINDVTRVQEKERNYHQLESQNKRLRIISRTDIITGLQNRTGYYAFKNEFAAAPHVCTACIYFDINGLHGFNEDNGHDAGDLMLKRFSTAIIHNFDQSKAFRMGGDEFVVFCDGLSEEQVHAAVKSVKNEFERHGHSFSCGIEYRTSDFDVDEMVNAADEKMYGDKSEYYINHKHRRK